MKGDMNVLRNEYELRNSLYVKLCQEVRNQLSELLRRERISLAFPIDSRVKSWESISEKCQRRDIAPAALTEIGDIAGLRIVLLYKRDQERVCEIIREHFEVLEVEDTTDRLSPDQFGYGSVHFQIKPKAEWLVVPTISELRGLQAEIQVRTASQHIWAEASQSLQYKRESHVPKPVLRTINRAAALLEQVDIEFDRVLTEREAYVGELGELEEEQPLNSDILEKILADELPSENKTDTGDNFGKLLDELSVFGINSGRPLRELLKKHRDAVFAAEEAALKAIREKKDRSGYVFRAERIAKGVFYSHVGLVRQALKEEFGKDEVDDVMREVRKKANSA